MDIPHIMVATTAIVGEESPTMCGINYAVTAAWADIPNDQLICRACVDATIRAMDASG